MLSRFLLLLAASLTLGSCYLLRAYKVRNFELMDHQKLPSVPVSAAASPYSWMDGTKTGHYGALKQFLDTNLANTYTAAFLVIRNDSILYENYFTPFDRSTILPSFSVAKSFVATLAQLALQEGKIKSFSEPVTAYLPELLKTDARYAHITLQHLLDMRSGLKFNEGSYGLKDDAIRLGFRPNLRKHALRFKIEKQPGGSFDYQSINTELIALVVEKATGKKLSAYLQEKLWHPLGAEYSATWNVDSKKHQQEIAFAGLNATARDFAKLGLLYLHNGEWNGQQLLDPAWIKTVNNRDSMRKWGGYKNQWWSGIAYTTFKDSVHAMEYAKKTPYNTGFRKNKYGNYSVGVRTPAFHAQGILEQYVYVNPANNVVIVRLGRHWKHPRYNSQSFVYAVGGSL